MFIVGGSAGVTRLYLFYILEYINVIPHIETTAWEYYLTDNSSVVTILVIGPVGRQHTDGLVGGQQGSLSASHSEMWNKVNPKSLYCAATYISSYFSCFLLFEVHWWYPLTVIIRDLGSRLYQLPIEECAMYKLDA